MACTTPCHCCKGACCTAGVCTQATCLACEAGGGAYQGAQSSCTPNPCSLLCSDCYRDCTALNDGAGSTGSCFGPPDSDPGLFWERTDSGVTYQIYMMVGRTYGNPASNCGAGLICGSRAYDPVTGEQRTLVYPVTLVLSADGCPSSLTLGAPSQEDLYPVCGSDIWYGCEDGMGDCMNVTPDTPGPFTFTCNDWSCSDDSECFGGYCVDNVCGPEAPPP